MPTNRLLVFALVLGVACHLAAQETPSYVLQGTLVTPDQVIENGSLAVAGDKIEAAGAHIPPPPRARVIETDSFIFPGLIDLHDHITWNLFPRWKAPQVFSNRYEWQALPAYKIAIETPHRELFKSEALRCDSDRYGEVKAIVGGATSVTGTLGPSQPGGTDNQCILGLARNLDFASQLDPVQPLNGEKVRYEVFPLEVPFDQAGAIRLGMQHGQISSLLVHLAEGKPGDAGAAREFLALKARGLLCQGTSIIHGVALGPAQFDEMARQHVGLIWSPRSNVELYGATTAVAAAKQAGVRIALAPDWSPTGSSGMLDELRYAATWNAGQSPKVFEDAELVRMATTYPAELAGVSGRIGSLTPGLYADLLLLRRRDGSAYAALLHSSPSDVRLVVIGGTPVYGDPDLMRQLLPGRPLELLSVCGEPKALYMGQGAPAGSTPKSWKQTTDDLQAALAQWGSQLAGLAECPK